MWELYRIVSMINISSASIIKQPVAALLLIHWYIFHKQRQQWLTFSSSAALSMLSHAALTTGTSWRLVV